MVNIPPPLHSDKKILLRKLFFIFSKQVERRISLKLEIEIKSNGLFCEVKIHNGDVYNIIYCYVQVHT